MNHAELFALATIVADSFHLSAFADACERAREESPHVWDGSAQDPRPDPRHGGDRIPHPGAGGAWENLKEERGDVPQSFRDIALLLLARVDPDTLHNGREAWFRLSGCDNERFGRVVAMRILGTGVGLSDDVCLTSGACAQDRADNDSVDRLSRALPTMDSSGELSLHYNPETGRCEP